MGIPTETLERAVSRLDRILETARALEERYREQLDQVHPDQRLSALNLLHYLALRHDNLTELQADLGQLGLTRLDQAEAHVMASLLAARHALCRLRGDDCDPESPPLSFGEGRDRVERHARALLGPCAGESQVGIMVTLPDEAAEDPALLRDMIAAGATCARINCGQNEPDMWERMIRNARQAAEETGSQFKVFMDLSGPRLRTGAMVPARPLPAEVRADPDPAASDAAVEPAPPDEVILLCAGDLLWLHKEPRPGEPAELDEEGTVVTPAHISCTFPEALDDLALGESVLFDEGKIHGVVRERRADGVLVEVLWVKKPTGTKLKANKGINLPDTDLSITGLTNQDLEDLRFLARHADGVDVSFINEPDDVEDLCDCLDACGGDHLGVTLKIETRRGFRNLPGILLAAMERPSVGVMIARGDLAVEAGWVHMPQIQEEILRLCEAAHVPVIWATQVLERLAKKGQPTRAEVTDAAIAERAECVMLNKGPFILDAIRTLERILTSVKRYQAKQAPLLGKLELAEPDPTEVGRAVGTRVGRFDG